MISTPTLSFHEHNTRTRVPQMLARLEAGASMALVTDAGTPGISDPGVELVRRAAAVDTGRSDTWSQCAAGRGSGFGFPLEPLTIFGFPPARSKDRETWLERLRVCNNP